MAQVDEDNTGLRLQDELMDSVSVLIKGILLPPSVGSDDTALNLTPNHTKHNKKNISMDDFDWLGIWWKQMERGRVKDDKIKTDDFGQ